MQSQVNTVSSLRRVFYEGFVAQDIAEPLASFDRQTDIRTVRAFMLNRPLSVVGIRENGVVTGFIQQDKLDDRTLAEQMQPLTETKVVSTSTTLHQVVAELAAVEFLLVTTLCQPGGVIVRNDFEKPPMRMWLFGMVTLFELSLTRIIQAHYPDESWTAFVSQSRLQKATSLQAERTRRNQSVRLLDCLQLGDKGQLLARSEKLREKFWNRSRRQITATLKEIESLRNNLAHSQPLVTENWDVIVRISATVDRFLEIPADLIAPSSLSPYNPSSDSDSKQAAQP